MTFLTAVLIGAPRLPAVFCFVIVGKGKSEASVTSAAAFAPRRIQIANALRKATRSEARSNYWLSVARALNEDNCNLPAKLQSAQQARNAAMVHAKVQRTARLSLTNDLGSANYDPAITTTDFSATVNNIYFPFVPGRTLLYSSIVPGGVEIIERQMTNETVVIDGVTCCVMKDLERLNGVLFEQTDDFYAQRTDGSVWYFGEVARQYKDGFLDSLEGSWRAGKDDAKPGITMPNVPVLGDLFRQEYLLNGAEDVAVIVSVGNTIVTLAGTFSGCIEMESSSPMEPAERERKFFAPNVGLVKEINLQTGAVYQLTQIIN